MTPLLERGWVTLVLLLAVWSVLSVCAAARSDIQRFLGIFPPWLPIADGPMPKMNEPVMSPGMKILVSAPACEVVISAGRGLKRTFSWNGETRSVEMWPRAERWHGSLGAYFPGPGDHWYPNGTIVRGVVDEGQLNFSSLDKAMKFLAKTPAFQPRIYRNDGFTVWCSKSEHTLGVDIFQVYINGVKPTKLPGAQDDDILVLAGELPPAKSKAALDSTELH